MNLAIIKKRLIFFSSFNDINGFKCNINTVNYAVFKTNDVRCSMFDVFLSKTIIVSMIDLNVFERIFSNKMKMIIDAITNWFGLKK